MKGAPREARDKRGNKAIDLVADLKSESLQKELRTALEEESSCDCLMLKTQLKKTEKSMQMPIVFLVIFDIIFVILIFFIFPGKQNFKIYFKTIKYSLGICHTCIRHFIARILHDGVLGIEPVYLTRIHHKTKAYGLFGRYSLLL